MTVEVRRGTQRFFTREVGRSTRHSFSFGPHYDQDNLGFGPMVCHDDHLLRAGLGFPDHSHQDVEIVTWVLSGALVHSVNSRGDGMEEHVLTAGCVQVQSAGSGIRHTEEASPDAGPTRFVQVWLRPDEPGGEPRYSAGSIDPEHGVLAPVVSGHDPTALLTVGVADATFWVAHLDRGQTLTLPDDRLQHVYVATGSLARSSLAQPLEAGDAFRITDRPGLEVTAASPTELLLWSFR